MGKQSMSLHNPILCETTKGNQTISTQILLDSGARGMFIHTSYVKKHQILIYPLSTPIQPQNIDGTPNKAGKITHFTWIKINLNGNILLEQLLVTNIGEQDILFGLPWFWEHNPQINWKQGKIKLDEFIKENFKKGYIHSSKSSMASPFFFISKKDGKL